METARTAGGPDARRDLVVVGASAGGVEVLTRLARELPADLKAAVCIVLHIAPSSPSMLGKILARAGPLPCRAAQDGDRLHSGLILVAPPDHHLVIEDGHVRLTVGPRENGHRPSIDVLFRSAAEALDSRVIGVILSGTRDDGSAGLAVIKATGGATIVQDPVEAAYGGMPASAIANVQVDAIVTSDRLASTIVAMVKGEDPSPGAPSEQPDPDPPAGDPDPPIGSGGRLSPGERDRGPGEPVSAICPECGGVLTERSAAGMLQWECRVGHRYSPDTMIDAQAESVESALWAAIRALNDRGILLRRMAEQAEKRGQTRSARRFRRQSESASEQAQIVRLALTGAAQTALRRVTDGADDIGEEGAA